MCICSPLTDSPAHSAAEHLGDLLVPDAVLGALAAGVGLLAMAMAEAGVHPQRDIGPGHPLRELLDHVGRATVDMDAQLRDRVEAAAVEDVGGVDDRMHGGRPSAAVPRSAWAE